MLAVQLVQGILGDGEPLLLGQSGDKGIEGRSIQGALLHLVGQGHAVAQVVLPGELCHVPSVLRQGQLGAVIDPVEQLRGGDVRLAHPGHHGVACQAGGGQIGIGDPGKVHGLHFRGAAAGAGGGAGSSAAAGKSGQPHNQGQGRGQNTFDWFHGYRFLSQMEK